MAFADSMAFEAEVYEAGEAFEAASVDSSAASTWSGDEDFDVEGVLAQYRKEKDWWYLVKWVGYPLDRASWEPEENLNDETLESWRKHPKQRGKRIAEDFDLLQWKRDTLEVHRAKRRRLAEKNRQRTVLGRPRKTIGPSLEAHLENVEATLSDSEAYRDSDSDYEERGTYSQGMLFEKASSSTRRNTSQSASRAPGTAPLGLAGPGPSRKQLLYGPQAYENVFRGGTTRKAKPLLMDAAQNPDVAPKMLNSRLQRLLFKSHRDKEGVSAPSAIPATLWSLDGQPHKTTDPSRSVSKRTVHWDDDVTSKELEGSLFVTPERDESLCASPEAGNKVLPPTNERRGLHSTPNESCSTTSHQPAASASPRNELERAEHGPQPPPRPVPPKLHRPAPSSMTGIALERPEGRASLSDPFPSRSHEPMPSNMPGSKPDRSIESGSAILVAPSFVISRPQQALQFFRWFQNTFSLGKGPFKEGKVVVSAHFAEWLLEVACEKASVANGATVELILRIWKIVNHLADEPEIAGLLVFAPEAIDDDDEQSLVNWYGWWTLTHADARKFRKFFVLGSSTRDKNRSGCDFTRNINPPSFCDSAAATETGTLPVDSNKRRMSTRQEQDGQARREAFTITQAKEQLMVISKELVQAPLNLYFYPIFCKSRDVLAPDALGPWPYNHSAKAWFQFFAAGHQQLNGTGRDSYRKPMSKRINTSVGFFCVNEAENIVRHPWVAVFRPANPHHRPWKATELLIWDAAAQRAQGQDGAPCLDDLRGSQRDLVAFVRDQSQSALGSLLPLSSVWLGGLEIFRSPGSNSDPTEATIDWLKKLPSHVKEWIPAPQHLLVERGWKQVSLKRAPARVAKAAPPARTESTESSVNRESQTAAAEKKKKKVVFHPPTLAGHGVRSGHGNGLQIWAERERRNGTRDRAPFTFRPTQEWYGEQVRNGQGLDQVDVQEWQAFFERYEVGGAGKG